MKLALPWEFFDTLLGRLPARLHAFLARIMNKFERAVRPCNGRSRKDTGHVRDQRRSGGRGSALCTSDFVRAATTTHANVDTGGGPARAACCASTGTGTPQSMQAKGRWVNVTVVTDGWLECVLREMARIERVGV